MTREQALGVLGAIKKNVSDSVIDVSGITAQRSTNSYQRCAF